MADISDTASTEAQADRIKLLARWGQIMCLAGIVMAVGTVLLAMVHQGFRDHLMFGGLQVNGGAPFPLSENVRQTMIQSLLLPTLCQALALWFGFRLFSGYRSGEIFTCAAGQRLARIGWCLLAMTPLCLFTKALMARQLDREIAASSSSLSLSPTIADFDVSGIAFGLLALIIGRVLSAAARISDENRSFV
jgi:Protein of unknown function (DUF2975)